MFISDVTNQRIDTSRKLVDQQFLSQEYLFDSLSRTQQSCCFQGRSNIVNSQTNLVRM